MLGWLKTLIPGSSGGAITATRRERRGLGMAHPYVALYEYLDARFADVVVMSFGEIEDLLGVALPVTARRDARWWANDDMTNAAHANAWLLARRTATPNLAARSVSFERGYRPGAGGR